MNIRKGKENKQKQQQNKAVVFFYFFDKIETEKLYLEGEKLMKGNGKKKILIGAITILFSFLLFSFTMISNAEEVTVVGTWDVSADDGTSNVTATLYSDGKMVISGTGNMESYSGSGETPYNAYISDIKTVEIQRGVTSIGYGAFSGCTSLSSITIPESVTSIGKYAFERCTSLSSITIPESVTRIGSYAFDGCTSLSSITIPDSVTSIGDGVFFGCTSLNSINVSIDNKNYSSEDGVLFDKEKTMLIKYPAGKVATEYTIPEGVTSIGEWTFRGCTSLSSITIPDSVTSIGMNAFSGCTSLSSITIPESVTRIGGYAFSGCTSLSSITIPEGVTYIGNGPFYACTSLNSINVSIDNKNYSSEDGVLFDKEKTELIQYPAGKVATEYTIPEGVTSIGSFAFNECTSLSSITIPESVTSIGNQAFYGAKLTMAVATGSENVQEMELPDIIKRAMNEGDILYSTEEFQLTNCTLNEDKTKLIVDTEVASKNTVSLYVTDGALKGLTVVVVVPSGTITYSTTSWTKDNVIAKIYVAEGETITNNSKSDTYIFERNDTFTFKYLTAEGEEREATATVENIEELTIKTYDETKEKGTKYIEGINPESTIQEVLNNIETNGIVTVYKEDAEIIDENTKAATSMIIKIKWGTVDEETYTLVVKGDLNGDGEMGDSDLLKLVRYQAGLDTNISGAYLKAADIYKDGICADDKDLLKIARVLAGLEVL